MNFLIVLAITVAAILALRNPIKSQPVVFYIICIAMDIALLASVSGMLPAVLRSPISILMQRGGLGVALFVIVMFIGVFPRNGKVSHWLRPIRAELSIMACLLIAGHMAMYLSSYLPNLSGGVTPKANVLAAFAIALVLLILVLVLGVTSFRFVKKHMKAKNWKRLQNAAYLFYVLIFAHLMLIFVPALGTGSTLATMNVVVYSIVFGAYIVLRIWRAIVDKREHIDLVSTVADQGFEG